MSTEERSSSPESSNTCCRICSGAHPDHMCTVTLNLALRDKAYANLESSGPSQPSTSASGTSRFQLNVPDPAVLRRTLKNQKKREVRLRKEERRRKAPKLETIRGLPKDTQPWVHPRKRRSSSHSDIEVKRVRLCNSSRSRSRSPPIATEAWLAKHVALYRQEEAERTRLDDEPKNWLPAHMEAVLERWRKAGLAGEAEEPRGSRAAQQPRRRKANQRHQRPVTIKIEDEESDDVAHHPIALPRLERRRRRSSSSEDEDPRSLAWLHKLVAKEEEEEPVEIPSTLILSSVVDEEPVRPPRRSPSVLRARLERYARYEEEEKKKKALIEVIVIDDE